MKEDFNIPDSILKSFVKSFQPNLKGFLDRTMKIEGRKFFDFEHNGLRWRSTLVQDRFSYSHIIKLPSHMFSYPNVATWIGASSGIKKNHHRQYNWLILDEKFFRKQFKFLISFKDRLIRETGSDLRMDIYYNYKARRMDVRLHNEHFNILITFEVGASNNFLESEHEINYEKEEYFNLMIK